MNISRLLSVIGLFLYSIICTAQKIENPVFDRTDSPEFHINKIESVRDTTFFYCSLNVNFTWANFSPNAYVEDVVTKKKYKVLKICGLPYAPEKKMFNSIEEISVILSFPFCQNISKCNLIEDPNSKAFNIYGICLNNQTKQYQKSDLNRFLTMSSFYDTASDTLKAIYYKKEEIEASKYFYGMMSEAVLCSSLGLSILYDKYGYHNEAVKLINSLSKLQDDSLGDYDLEYCLLNRTFSSYYSILYNYDYAINTFIEAISLYKKLGIVDNVYALLLRFIANDYCASGDENNFLNIQRKCLEVRRKLGNGKSYLEDLLILLMRNAKPVNYVERIAAVVKEIEFLPNCVDTQSLDYVFFLKYLTLMYGLIDNRKKAVELCDMQISILEKDVTGNIHKIAETQLNKCKYLNELGYYNDAILVGLNAKELIDSMPIKPIMYKELLNTLAGLYGVQYDYETSIRLMDQLIAICEQEEDWLTLTESLYVTGTYCNNKGDFIEAENYLRKALEIINQHDKAEDYLKKEIELYPESVDPKFTLIQYNDMIMSTKAATYGCLGFLSSNKGNYEEAISYELRAGEFMKVQLDNYTKEDPQMLGGNKLYANHLLTLSRYYTRNKQYEVSNRIAQESIDYFKKGGSLKYFNSYFWQAINKSMVNDIDSAIYYAKKAFVVSDSTNNIIDKNRCLSLLAYMYCSNNDFKKAEEYLSRALDCYQDTINKNLINMTNEQKQRLWDLYEYPFLKYRDIIVKNEWNAFFYSKLLNYTLFSKGLLLDSDMSKYKQLYKGMTVDWKEIQRKLSSKDIAIEFITTKDSINLTYYALIIDKNCKYPNLIFLFNQSDYFFQNIIQNNTKADLEIIGDLVWKPILNQYNQVENVYFSPDGILNVLPVEYSKVEGIGEITEHYNLYRLSSTKEIVFHNKELSKNNAVLYGGLDYDMLAKESSNYKEEGKEYSLLRSINARGGFDPLLSTLEEVNEISDILKKDNVSTTLYTGEYGTEDSFKNLSGKDINLLHLSTHGMYVGPNIVEQKRKENNFDFLELITNEKDPVKEDIVLTHSFLVMSGGNKLSHREKNESGMNDGILTAFEISQTDLSKVDLVVLSACETGLGDVDNGGVYGLQRGFKKSGANTILMSLDKVDDEATKILMVEFYKNLMSGKSKHQSLKDAQKHLRQVDNGKYDKPEYWASFIMLDGFN